MNKVEKYLVASIHNMQGHGLGFGTFGEKVMSEISKNSLITEFDFLSSNEGRVIRGGNVKKHLEKIPYRKMRKKFRKKRIDYIIANYDELGKYHRRFVMDSLYLAKNKIDVIVRNEDIDIELLAKRYQRFHIYYELIHCKDGVILHIEKENYKKNKFRDSFYLLIDSFVDIVNFIGDLFVI